MTKYKMFESMLNAQKENNETEFIFYAIQIVGACKENPYTKGSQEALIFYPLHGYYVAYESGRVGDRKAKLNIIDGMKAILKINPNNPFDPNEIEIKNERPVKKVENPKQEETPERFEKNEDIEVIQDIRYVMLAMVKAYNEGNTVNFKQFAIHLVDIAEENPFMEGTEEFNIFAEMVMVYRRKPSNIRRVHVLAEKLCEIINTTEIYPEKIQKKEKKTVLGVLPEEDKKSWFKFLHPWKKEGENDDN